MTFVAIALGLLLILGILTRRVALIWRILGVALVVGLAWIVIRASLITMRAADESWFQQTPYKQMVALAMMICGMGAKHLFDLIEARRQRRAAGEKRARMRFDRWDFAQPFLVGVIVFGSFWDGHGNEMLDINWLVMSFQNGFFWQTVLGKTT